MKAKQKICLIGGTFDPIHLGHTYIAEKCYRELNMDKIIFLPCKQSPHKLTKKNAPDHHRLAMCQLAISSFPWAEVDDYDLTAPSPSYSWRTAEFIKEKHPNAELFWLMGTDQWEAILHWDRPQYLASLVNFIVISRDTEPEYIDGLSALKIGGSHSASSTYVRKNTSSCQTRAWLNPPVLAYIQEHNVY
ncbi:MAG: nicotinate-nucleotide adenylyltransferase [Rubritalea sp.]|jgi:nicotinate-nucleotide adenylyltransferase